MSDRLEVLLPEHPGQASPESRFGKPPLWPGIAPWCIADSQVGPVSAVAVSARSDMRLWSGFVDNLQPFYPAETFPKWYWESQVLRNRAEAQRDTAPPF